MSITLGNCGIDSSRSGCCVYQLPKTSKKCQVPLIKTFRVNWVMKVLLASLAGSLGLINSHLDWCCTVSMKLMQEKPRGNSAENNTKCPYEERVNKDTTAVMSCINIQYILDAFTILKGSPLKLCTDRNNETINHACHYNLTYTHTSIPSYM